MSENETNDEANQANAIEGATGTRISSFDEDVASSLVSDLLTGENNRSNERIIVLLQTIRALCIALLIIVFVLVGIVLFGQ